MIAVAGAAGKTGRAVIDALKARQESVRPLVRRPSGMDQEVVVDLLDPESLRTALLGVRAVYHKAPNMHPAEFEMGQSMISAAEAAGVERIVFHSVLHPQLSAMPHHWDKLRVEAAVIDSRLRWSILQPAPYAQNFTRTTDGVLRVAYRVDAPFSFVDLLDVSEAAAIALTTNRCEFGIYELAGPQITSVAEIASILGMRAESMDPLLWQRAAVENGLSPEAAKRLVAMFSHYDRHGLVGNPASLAQLLGRRPNSASEALLRGTRP